MTSPAHSIRAALLLSAVVLRLAAGPLEDIAEKVPDKSAPFGLVVRVSLKPGSVDAFRMAAQVAVEGSRAEPGNLAYEVHRMAGDTAQVVFIEKWRSFADLEAHFARPYTVAVLQALGEAAAGAPEIAVTTPFAVAARDLSTPQAAAASAWPMFRGPNASGVSDTATPPLRIAPDENVAWKVAVPAGGSSPCVWGDRLFLTAVEGGKLVTRAHALADGRLLWSRAAPVVRFEEYHPTEGSPAASTPATDGTHVVSYFGSGALVAYDMEGGELWKVALPMATTGGNFGSGTSPTIVDGVVVLNRDMARDSRIMAFDVATGAKLWDTPKPASPTSYGTPVVWRHDGVAEVVAAGALTLRAFDPRSGAERWLVRGLPSFSCPTPVVGGGMLFFAGWSPGKADAPWPGWAATVERQDKDGDGKISVKEFEMGPDWFKAQDMDGDGFITESDWTAIANAMKAGENQLLAIRPGGAGDVTDTHVAWRATRGLPYVPSALYHAGRVYLVKDGGMASCFDAATGNPVYQQERLDAVGNYYASPVLARGHIYVASLDGKFTVYKAGGDKPEVVSRSDFGERIWATSAPVGDALYVRTAGHLYAFAQGRR